MPLDDETIDNGNNGSGTGNGEGIGTGDGNTENNNGNGGFEHNDGRPQPINPPFGPLNPPKKEEDEGDD